MGVVLFYISAIGFACGIFARSFFSFGLPTLLWGVLMGTVLLLLWYRKRENTSSPIILYFGVFLLSAFCGALRFEYATYTERNPYFESNVEQEVSLEGVVIREPDHRENTTHLYVSVDDELLLVIDDAYSTVAYGDTVHIEGKLVLPESFKTDLGRTFNYPGYLHAKKVTYMVQFAEVTVVSHDNGSRIIASVFKFKHAFMQRIEQYLPEPHAGLSEGLLLGVKRALGEELELAFRKTGIIHIVVLSGYNIMLVVVFVTFILGVIIPRNMHLVFGLCAIVLFAIMVGLSSTVVRASIMASLALVAKTTNRTYMVTRALLLSGVLMLVLNPYLLAFDTGFQLSFTATLGLILLAPHLEAKLQFVPALVGARGFLTATLATQIFVLPVLLYQIGEFSVVSVLVNVLVLPMVPVAMFLTFVTGVVGFFFGTPASLVAYFAYLSLAYILQTATFFASLPFASFVVPMFPFWMVVVSYGVLGYVLWRVHHLFSCNTDELKGWVIEEFDEVQKRIAAGSRSDPAAKDTPVFFK